MVRDQALIRLFLSKLFSDRAVWVLPVSAFAIVSTLALTVVAGARYIGQIPGMYNVLYLSMALLAVFFLVIPMAALTGAATKLLARRRDERLSSLRLLGASNRTIRVVALSEAMVLATVGILIGVVGYLVLMPIVGLLHFGGAAMGVAGMWLGPLWLTATVAAMILFVAAASLSGLRKIQITPLGVRTRQTAAKVHWGRIAVGAGVFIAAQVMARVSGVQNLAVVITITLLALAIPMLALYFIGPWILKIVARGSLKRARSVQRLVAARTILESPQQAWRQVGGLAATVYIALVGGAGIALIRSLDDGDVTMTSADYHLLADVQNGVLLTLLISFLLVACSVGITETAQVLDRQGLYRGLDKLGMPRTSMNDIRRRAIFTPIWVVLLVAGLAAGVTALPIVGAAFVLTPTTMLLVVGAIGLGMLLLDGGVRAATPTLKRVLATP